MNLATRQLAVYIRGEMENLAQIVQRAKQRIESAKKTPEDIDSYIEAAALNLQSFYTATEQILTRIAETVNGVMPDGETWHTDLLRQMTYELPGRRPPILRPETHDSLDELRGFRHRVRNIYTFRLNTERVQALVEDLPKIYKALSADLDAFLELLDQISEEG